MEEDISVKRFDRLLPQIQNSLGRKDIKGLDITPLLEEYKLNRLKKSPNARLLAEAILKVEPYWYMYSVLRRQATQFVKQNSKIDKQIKALGYGIENAGVMSDLTGKYDGLFKNTSMKGLIELLLEKYEKDEMSSKQMKQFQKVSKEYNAKVRQFKANPPPYRSVLPESYAKIANADGWIYSSDGSLK